MKKIGSVAKMNRKKLVFLGLVVLFLFSACAGHQATWKTVPKVDISFERAWTIIVNSITSHFDLEISDGQSGYLKTGWKTTRKDFLGSPVQRTRVVVRVQERIPFKVKVKVEKQKINALTDEWYDSGNDEKIEREIMEELSARLINY